MIEGCETSKSECQQASEGVPVTSRPYHVCMAWDATAGSYLQLQRRGRRLAVVMLVLCAVLAGLAASHIWTVAHNRSCIVIPPPGSKPPYRCGGTSTATTVVFPQVVFPQSAPKTSIPAP